MITYPIQAIGIAPPPNSKIWGYHQIGWIDNQGYDACLRVGAATSCPTALSYDDYCALVFETPPSSKEGPYTPELTY